MDKKVNITVGPGAGSLLGILFVALKLTGYIDWSWFWVTAPFGFRWRFFSESWDLCLSSQSLRQF